MNGGQAFLVQTRHGVHVHFQHHHFQSMAAQHLAHQFAAGAVAHQQDAVHIIRNGGYRIGLGMPGADAAFLQLVHRQRYKAVKRRIQGDGHNGYTGNHIHRFHRQQLVSAGYESGQNEREFPNLRERTTHHEAQTHGFTQNTDHDSRHNGLGQHADSQGSQSQRPVFQQTADMEAHAHRYEEQDGKGITHGQSIARGAAGKLALSHHHAGEKSSELHGGIEHRGRKHGNTQYTDKHGQREELIRAVTGYIGESLFDKLAPEQCHHNDQQGEFHRHQAERRPQFLPAEDGRQQHQQNDGEHVFHHQPAQRRVPGGGLQHPVIAQYPGEHHGTGHTHAEAEHEAVHPGHITHTQEMESHHTQQGNGQHAHQGPRHSHFLHSQQILDMELQPHTKEQQHHANVRKILHYVCIHRFPPPGLCCQHAGHQIPHQGRQAEFLRQHTQYQRERKANNKSENHKK